MKEAKSNEHIQVQAVWIYLIYSAFNGATHSSKVDGQSGWNEQETVDLFRQKKLSQIRGQIRACCWLPPPLYSTIPPTPPT